MSEVNVFRAGALAKFCLLEPGLHTSRFPKGGLTVSQLQWTPLSRHKLSEIKVEILGEKIAIAEHFAGILASPFA